MPATLRELRQRRKSVTATKKITRAMELIAATRIVKAQLGNQAGIIGAALLGKKKRI